MKKYLIIVFLIILQKQICATVTCNLGNFRILVKNFNWSIWSNDIPQCFTISDQSNSVQFTADSRTTLNGDPEGPIIVPFYVSNNSILGLEGNGCGVNVSDNTCYEIKPCDWQIGDQKITIKLNSNAYTSIGNLTINYDYGTKEFSIPSTSQGNTSTYSINTCRFCLFDVYYGDQVGTPNSTNFNEYLTESDNFIETVPNLTIDPTANVKFDADPSDIQGYVLLGEGFYSEPTTGYFLARCMDGCGYLIPPSTINTNFDVSACNAYTWAVNGATYTNSGTYFDSLINFSDEDIAVLNLTINHDSIFTANATACNSYIWSKNGLTYTSSGTYHNLGSNGAGCLRDEVLNLTINTSTNSTSSATSCNSYTWSASGLTYTASGVYTKTTLNTAGCVNTATLNLTINQSTTSTSSVTASGSYTWAVNGLTYIASGTYTATSLNAAGCLQSNMLNLTITASSGATLNLKCFIEGYMYSSNSMQPVLANQGVTAPANACDSITVELHSANSPFNMLYSTKAVLQQNGNATCVFTSSIANGSYYIVVKHRNGIQTWSSTPLSFDPNLPVVYNFTTSSSQAYGSNQVQVASGVWAFFSGDVEVDENMDLLDLSLVETDINNFGFGYLATDINGDGNVDLLDTPILQNNIDNFIFSAHP